MPHCLICDHLLSPVAQYHGWCDDCATRALDALLSLRDGPTNQLGVRVAIMQDWHAPFLGRVITGSVPFDGEEGR